MKKGAKRKGVSKAGRKAAVAETQNDEVIEETTKTTQEESQQHEEEVVDEVKENGEEEEAKGDQEEEEDAKPDSLEEDEENQEDEVKAEEVKEEVEKKPVARRGGKRKRATKKDTEIKDEKKPVPKAKKPRAAKVKEEPVYFEEKRSLEDLWKVAFPVGTEWDQLDALYEFNWDFQNLEEALEEGGKLYGKKVYVFGCTEPQLVPYKGANKIVHVPAVVVIESPFPPSDKIGITSVQREVEEIIPMKKMKMDWLPYIPIEKRDRQVDKMNSQIFTLGCTQRR
jgi:hypothetical protein